MPHPPIYTLTFEEVEDRVNNGETLVTSRGYLIHSKDRKITMRERWDLWQQDVLAAESRGDIPQLDREKKMVFPQTKKSISAKDPRPLDKKGRPFSWSLSALRNFEGCPLRYAQEKYYKTLPYIQSDAAIWGDRGHKAAEGYVKGLPTTDPEALKAVAKYAVAFKKLKDSGVVVEPELQIVLNQNMKRLTGASAWFSKDAWFRCSIDVLVATPPEAKVFDYKTGGSTPKDDVDQLKLYLAVLMLTHPDIETGTGKLIYTKFDNVTQGVTILRSEVPEIWAGYIGRVKRMEDAWRTENFPARPSGLCKWKGGTAMGGGQCGYYDKCECCR